MLAAGSLGWDFTVRGVMGTAEPYLCSMRWLCGVPVGRACALFLHCFLCCVCSMCMSLCVEVLPAQLQAVQRTVRGMV
jgi:hypothetical protein